MNYANLISAMSAVIKANGNNEITGNLLQQVLRAIINSLGQGYQFMGVATAATDPGTQDARLFYVAEGPGTYSNFGPLTVPDDGQVYLLVLGASWAAVQLPIPTFAGFSDLVTEVAGKMALVPTATEGHVAEFGNAGQVRDGGVQTSALARRDAGATAGNLAEFDGNGDPKDSGIAARDVMKIPAGLMPFGPAGLAEALLDTDSAGNVQEFSLRKSGGDGGAYFRRLLGNTKAFNQLARQNVFSTAAGNTLTLSDGIYTFTAAAQNAFAAQSIGALPIGHSILVVAQIKKTTASADIRIRITETNITVSSANTAEWQTISGVGTINGSGSILFRVVDYRASGWDAVQFRDNVMFIDLTAMQDNSATPEEFREKYPLLYYAYGRKLIHCKVAKVITKGANQWDEVWESGTIDPTTGQNAASSSSIRSKNYIPVIGGATYYNKGYTLAIVCYDANKNFVQSLGSVSVGEFAIPAGVAFIRFRRTATSYANDICINLSDAEINGQYFPYWERELALDITNQEDTDGNKPFAEGVKSCPVASDEFNEVGGIVRVGVRPYQASDDTDASVITDGVDTAYALTTPVPFTWKEPLNTGIKVSKYGTEEITPAQTENIDNAPFRAVTTYSISVANLVAALSALGNRGGAKGLLGGGNQEENPENEELIPEEESPKGEAPKEEETPVVEPIPEVQSKK